MGPSKFKPLSGGLTVDSLPTRNYNSDIYPDLSSLDRILEGFEVFKFTAFQVTSIAAFVAEVVIRGQSALVSELCT